MYESPIKILQDQIVKDFARKIDEETGKAIYEATQRIGITVDDNELLKALRYDRASREIVKKGLPKLMAKLGK